MKYTSISTSPPSSGEGGEPASGGRSVPACGGTGGLGPAEGGGCSTCPHNRVDKMKRFAQVWRNDKNIFTCLMAVAKVRRDYGLSSFEEAAEVLVQVYKDYSTEIEAITEFLNVFAGLNPIGEEEDEEDEEPENARKYL